MWVSLESRKGATVRRWVSESAVITRPSVESDLLIFEPSFSESPVAPVAFERSLPARSMRFNLEKRRSGPPAAAAAAPKTNSANASRFDFRGRFVGSGPPISSSIIKITCERLLSAFMLVARTSRWLVAPMMHWLSSSTLRTGQEQRPSTYTPFDVVSRIRRLLPLRPTALAIFSAASTMEERFPCPPEAGSVYRVGSFSTRGPPLAMKGASMSRMASL
mmetsp:Transcript_170/g.355  ORF Transcript_170/g.355 Transcript_170/m.355 type:complete len:219 (+) Transcript_170:1396-2052(+)